MTPGAWPQAAEVVRYGADWPVGLLVPLFVMAMIVIVAVSLHAAAQRRKELLQWATAHGLTFSSARTSQLEHEYPNFSCLRQGHSRHGHNLLHGRWNQREMLGFDYHYVTGHGKNRRTHLFSAVILESNVALQPLLIRPEGFLDKISEFFGADDIDFESAEFSRRFYVKAPNKRWAYDVIHARTMEFLLASPPFSIQFDLRRVICYRDRRFAPADFEAACQVVAGLLDRLPEYVVRQQGGGRQGEV